MTQLPEIEVARRDFEKEIVGKKIKEAWASPADLVKRHGTIKDFVATLEGSKISGLDRRGKLLLVEFEDDKTLVIEPGSRARLTKETATADRGEHVRMTFAFTTGGSVHYHDLEADGSMFVIDTEQVADLDELKDLGMDPLGEQIPWTAFGQALAARDDMLKAVLVDDSFVLGLGDIYADEVLFEAGLGPARPSTRLSSQEVRRLHRAILEVIYEAIKQGGTDQAPEEGVDGFLPYDEVDHLKIYARAGQPDARSRATIEHTEIRKGLMAYHAPKTQT